MSTRPYPSYKDSGAKWFASIPAPWEALKLKYVATVQPSNVDKKFEDGELPVKLCNYVDVYYHDRITADMDFMRATATEAEKRKFQLRAGDVCVTKDSEEWSDIAVPACVAEDVPDLLCGYHLALVRPRVGHTHGEFLARAFSARGVNDQFRVEANGITRFALGQDALCNALFPVPPLDEQKGIAEFLDRETGKIDALVKKKERLIELLQEQRTALISHAVTQGLNPNAPMKDSGIPWLGHIPKHWEAKRLKFVAATPLAYGANESAEANDPSLPRFIRITDIKSDGSLHDDTFRSLPEEVARPFLLEDGDLLLARSGATVGKTFMYRPSWGRACHAGYLIRCRVSRAVATPEFVSYFATSAQYWGWLSSVFIQATIQNVSAEKYANLWLPTPPLPEQTTIALFLDRETAKLDALTAKVRAAIERLQEYRTALISAAVTGQIDVRHYQVKGGG